MQKQNPLTFGTVKVRSRGELSGRLCAERPVSRRPVRGNLTRVELVSETALRRKDHVEKSSVLATMD